MMKSYSHAGGIVFRRRQGADYFLIVRAKPNPTHWVIPKGHIEPHETPEDAARREIREETGVVAEIVAPLGELRFAYRGAQINTIVYLLEYQAEATPLEEREHRWGLFDEVVGLLTFADTQELLRGARDRLAKRPR